jgi:demethylmenaquinone methyltransferase/2-methoxy-6-polyprenyl-1,4-benzoquinol methylase
VAAWFRAAYREAVLQRKLVGSEKERYVNEIFGSIALKYDLLNSIISLGRHKSWRKTAVKMSELAPGSAALDVATGTGDLALELARLAGSSGQVVGSDFCGPMLELAHRKLGDKPNIKLVTANAEHLPFAADTFDCATIGFALRNVANVSNTIAEMTRVIKPGGRVISLEIVGPRSQTLQPFWHAYFSKMMPRVAQIFGAEREPYEYLPDSVKRFYSREELADIFEDSGLVDITIRDLTMGVVCIHAGTKR